MQIKKQHLESYMELWTTSKLRKEYEYIYSTLGKIVGWMNLKLESRLQIEMSTT